MVAQIKCISAGVWDWLVGALYSTCIVHLCSQGLITMLAYEMIMWTLSQLGRLSLVYIGTILLFGHISRKHNFFLENKQILMKLYTVLVYKLRKCMKEDYPGQKKIK